MRSRIYQPSHIESKSVSEKCWDEQCIRPSFTPTVNRYDHWNEETHQWHKYKVISKNKKIKKLKRKNKKGKIGLQVCFQDLKLNNKLFLKHEYWIVSEITHVDALSFDLDFRVLTNEQPSNVREEKASFRVMWISVSFTVFVMQPVISCPINSCVLK